MEATKKPSARTTGRTDRAGTPQNHQMNHHKRPPNTPITDVPAARPVETFNVKSHLVKIQIHSAERLKQMKSSTFKLTIDSPVALASKWLTKTT